MEPDSALRLKVLGGMAKFDLGNVTDSIWILRQAIPVRPEHRSRRALLPPSRTSLRVDFLDPIK